MSLGTAAVAGLAMILGLGGVSTFILSDDQPSETQAIQMSEEGINRQDDDDDDVLTKDDDDDDGDGDNTRGNDGTSGGNNTGDGDNTWGNDGTSGGNNTGDGDNTWGNDGTSVSYTHLRAHETKANLV